VWCSPLRGARGRRRGLLLPLPYVPEGVRQPLRRLLLGAWEFVGWETGDPTYLHSSNIARRGFCRECGTPLSFECLGSEEIHLTVGSLDEPGRLRPVAHYGFESHVSSFFTDDGLPRSRMEDDDEYVARWKTSHGQDSMPGPLLGPTT
jgi:Glutathione-dependent formaldehyde-activating enzyme